MVTVPLRDLDVIFLSYDEPRCEEFWHDLVEKCPWARRVHGAKGFDLALKEAATLSTTPFFVAIDGDSIVDGSFFDTTIEGEKLGPSKVISWRGRNVVNGLVYDNGGPKCWPRDLVLSMKSREDFERGVADIHYQGWGFDHWYEAQAICSVHPNGSPYQAFRSGFREGVKLGLVEGRRVEKHRFTEEVNPMNFRRLLVWSSVGADSENGLWAIYGARLGCQMANLTDWDIPLIDDYDWFARFWEDEISPLFEGRGDYCSRSAYGWDRTKLEREIALIGGRLRSDLGLPLVELGVSESRFFKETLVDPPDLAELDSKGRRS